MSRARIIDALALIVASALFALASRQPALAAIPTLLALGGLAVRQGARADAFAQTATSLVAGALPGYLAINVIDREVPLGVLDPTSGSIALATLCAASVRTVFSLANSRAGLVNSALLFVALASVGQSRLGAPYALLAALASTLSLVSRAIERDPSLSLSRSQFTPRALWPLAAIVAITSALTSLGAWGLPIAHRWSVRRMVSAYSRAQNISGLGDRMSLQAMDGILQSDAIVLRVRGGSTDYLRGVAFDRYRLNTWSYSRPAARRRVAVTQRTSGILPGEIELLRVSGPAQWVLAPLEAGALASPDGELEALPTGALRSAADVKLLWFARSGPRSITVDPPGPYDTEYPRVLAPMLLNIGREWRCLEGPALERVRCFERRLRREYRYSLTVPETPDTEPLVAFLRSHKQGHCEYFASALALLSRTANVPTRVVAGYRVHERSEWGDYYVVRERDAHSWVEAYEPSRGWVRFDATPPSADERGAGSAVPAWRTFIESLRWRWADFWSGGRSRGAFVLAALALALGLLVSVLRRNARAWFGRAGADERDAPPASLLALDAALARWSIVRERGESIERFSSRVEQSALPEELAKDTAAALRAFARQRYGAPDGDDALAPLEAQLTALATALLDARRASAPASDAR